MTQSLHELGSHNVMCLIYQDELESLGVKFEDPTPGDDAPYRSNSDICTTRGMRIGHFDLDRLGWIRIFAMSSGLFDKLAPVYQDQSLRGIWCWCLDAINELCEDDLSIDQCLHRASSWRNTVLPLPERFRN